jgi:N-acetylglucosamine-6-sulfatase
MARSTMSRKAFLATLAGAAAAPAIHAAPAKRNMIFILVDDHRWDMTSAMAHPWLLTPNIDRLAGNGVDFQNSFITTSLCSPSRASILTSQYMHAHGVRDNFTPLDPAIPTFPAELQKAGYNTGFVGKWHMGGASDEQRPGFDHWISFRGQGDFFNPTLNFNGDRRRMMGYTTDLLTKEAIRYIRRNDHNGTPFFLYLSHKAVHHDFQPAPRHSKLYGQDEVPHPRSMAFREEFYEQWPEWVKRRRYSRHGIDGILGQTATMDEFYRDYCRCLAAVDESVGEILNELEEKRLLNDTLIVYMGDNGYLWGEHGLVDKRAMYEPSIRVPLYAHCPDLFQGRRKREELALNLDIGPTFLDAAGVAAPATFHGRSLTPLFGKSTETEWRSSFVYEYEWERDYPYTPTTTGLRSDQHALMRYYGLWDIDELYDVRKDPAQMDNLLSDVRIRLQRGRIDHQIPEGDMKETVVGLQKQMARILADTGGDPRLSGLIGEGDKLAW